MSGMLALVTDDFFFFTWYAKWKAPRQLIRSLSGVLWSERLFPPFHISPRSRHQRRSLRLLWLACQLNLKERGGRIEAEEGNV